MLRPNQQNAINISKENDFISGIHYHATGTGKSWIAMYIVEVFNNKYPNKNVLWICERKIFFTTIFIFYYKRAWIRVYFKKIYHHRLCFNKKN